MHAEPIEPSNTVTNTDEGGHVRNQEYIEQMVAARTGHDPLLVKHIFNTFWTAICDELEAGNRVKLHGKGQYYLSKRKQRIGRNPTTREEYDVPEREAMAFSPSPAYAKRLREVRAEAANRQSKAKKRRPTNRRQRR